MEQGNTYQINYTVQQVAENIDDGRALFQRMADDAPYAAYLECEDHTIISASPELFFRLSDGHLACKPMKGTARRGLTSKDDARLRQALEDSPKERAENLMILGHGPKRLGTHCGNRVGRSIGSFQS